MSPKMACDHILQQLGPLFKKIEDWILNLKEPKNRFCISQIMLRQRNRRIHFQSGFFGSFNAP